MGLSLDRIVAEARIHEDAGGLEAVCPAECLKDVAVT